MTAPRRRFGASPVSLSTICYGTMRLVPTRFTDDEIRTLFVEALDRGITSFHVSHEYESYPGVCRALREAARERPSVGVEIIAKLAVPHFDERELDPRRLRALVESTLSDLGIEQIAVVQWLARHTPNEDEPRLALLDRGAPAFFAEWNRLRNEGKVGALGVFPYSDAFLRRALEFSDVDGVVSYYNLAETELAPYLDGIATSGRGVIGIRPLRGGAVRDEAEVANAIAFALDHSCIASTVIGLSSSQQIQQALAWVGALAVPVSLP